MTPTWNVDQRLNITKEISKREKYMALVSRPLLMIPYLIFRFYQIGDSLDVRFTVKNMVQ